nr:MAG TPA: hypothetical protein [Bacteriophage sp.]
MMSPFAIISIYGSKYTEKIEKIKTIFSNIPVCHLLSVFHILYLILNMSISITNIRWKIEQETLF